MNKKVFIGRNHYYFGDSCLYCDSLYFRLYWRFKKLTKQDQDEVIKRIKEFYHKVVSGNEDYIPFKAISTIEKGKILVIRYKNLERGLVYEWIKENHQKKWSYW